MLDDAGLEAGDDVVERTPVAVEPLHPHLRMPRHQPAQVGDGQAPLPVVGQLPGLRGDHGVDDHVQRDLRRAGRLVDEDLGLLAHLRRGEPHAVGFVHRLDHVVDQRLELRLADPLRRNGEGRRAEGGVAEADDGSQGHARALYPAD